MWNLWGQKQNIRECYQKELIKVKWWTKFQISKLSILEKNVNIQLSNLKCHTYDSMSEKYAHSPWADLILHINLILLKYFRRMDQLQFCFIGYLSDTIVTILINFVSCLKNLIHSVFQYWILFSYWHVNLYITSIFTMKDKWLHTLILELGSKII